MAMPDVIIRTKDFEYEKAKNNFYKELRQFQKERGLGVKKLPKINGREIDLFLLYQHVTSRGGGDKVNSRNEWDDLLEHFKLPATANGGVAFKQIYQRQLELYEKINFLGEVNGKEDDDDDYEDSRHRRRPDYRKSVPQTTPAAGTSATVTPHPGHGPIAESLRLQYGLSRELANTSYDKLILTLQSPLPNEQDVAIGVCSLLSNETKHVLQLAKCPRLVDHLLAHAGVFSHCSLRELTEQVYNCGRGYSLANFWRENMCSNDALDLLCEEFVNKYRNNLGINLYENDLPKLQDEESEPINSDPVVEDESKELDKQSSITPPEVEEPEEDFPDGEENATPSTPSLCCASCVCHKDETVFCLKSSDDGDDPSVVSFRRSKNTEQAGLRITQICHIIRNLSFEHGNAEVMGRNQTVQRFLLLCMKCQWSNLSQLCWDSFGNIARHMELKEPMLDPLSSMFISMTIESLLSPDRFHIMRSLEILNGWFAGDLNDKILLPYLEAKIFERVCELLGINDIMLLIYTLECMLSMTARGEEVCDNFARVDGSVDMLVSLVTVEAQSYGPRGCIAMRVVETVSTIHPVAQPPRPPIPHMQQPQIGAPGLSQERPVFRPSFLPQTQQAPVQAQYQRLPTPLSNTPSPPPKLNNMYAAATWTPSLTQMPSSFAPTLPPPPHIPNLSPMDSMKFSPSTIPNTRPQGYQTLTSVNSNSPVLPTSTQNYHARSPFTPLTASPAANPYTTSPTTGHPQQQAQRLLVSPPSSEVYNPTFNAVTPDGRLSEEGWAMAWLKGAFDQAPGTSIEQGELYRMYCVARKSPNTILSMNQFVSIVKTVYGSSIGPVMKMFGGGSSLAFIEGIRPKLATRNFPIGANSANTSTTNSVSVSNCVSSNSPTTGSVGQTSVEPSQLPVSVNIPNEDKTAVTSTSPILKATLSRPPKTNNSVVAQRQQKKLQQPETKKVNSKTTKATSKKVIPKKKASENTINGVLDSIVNAASEECSLSSLNSVGSCESTPPPLISFQGVLQNGLSSGESSKDADFGPPHLKEELTDIKQQNKLKGMLVDLLERKVGPREPTVNGLIGNREIRISDKGLEIVDQEENSNSNNSTLSGTPPVIHGLSNSVPTSAANETIETCMNDILPSTEDICSTGGSGDNSEQQMTFYSDGAVGSQVTFKGQINQLNHSSSATVSTKNNHNNKINHITNNDDNTLSDGGGGELSGDSGSNGINCTVGANSSNSDNSKEIEHDENACNDFDNARFAPDLIDKFNEISDLIMVSPEQLGIKRSRSLSSDKSSGHEGGSDQPPFKKPSLSTNGCGSTPPPLTSTYASTVEVNANSYGARNFKNISTLDNEDSKTTSAIKSEIINENHVLNNNSESLTLHKPTATNPKTTVNSTTSSLNISIGQTSTTNTQPAVGSNSLVQYPVTIAMNHATNQLTFARQLVLPSGQPILLKTPNSQTPLQGQVIISKPSSSANDQIPKAIIILQQPQSTGLPQTSNTKMVTAGAHKLEPIVESPKTQEQLDLEIPYLCEWAGCGLRFTSSPQVMLHAAEAHCSEAVIAAVRCEWGQNGCDPLLRKRYSLMTHLQDRHCSKQALDLALYRRKNKIDPPPPPQQPIHHPGYAPNAAFHAIRRHALQFMNPRELMDDNEGPVTKSIRLSAALILRNVCMHSSIGRKKLKAYESHLSSVGMSNVESSRTIAHLLYELHQSH